MEAFESVGTSFESTIGSFAEDTSSALIGNISPVLFIGVSLYFLLKGWMFLTGRAEGAISDTVITAFKIALVSMVGLNSGNFVSWGIGFINGAESLLMSSLPGGSTSGWQAIDNMWSTTGDGVAAMFQIFTTFGLSEMGYAVLFALLLLLFFFAGAFLTLAALGVMIIAKLSLVMVMGFGPLFICLLMFPLTRTWFDGWLKSCLTYVFTMVMLAALLSLVTQLFSDRIAALNQGINNGFDKKQAVDFLTNVFTFLIVCIALATMIRAVPTMAAGVVGSAAMGAVGLGSMIRGIGGGAASMTAGYAIATGHKQIANAASTISRSDSNFQGGLSAGVAAGAGIRAARALNAAINRPNAAANAGPALAKSM